MVKQQDDSFLKLMATGKEQVPLYWMFKKLEREALARQFRHPRALAMKKMTDVIAKYERVPLNRLATRIGVSIQKLLDLVDEIDTMDPGITLTVQPPDLLIEGTPSSRKGPLQREYHVRVDPHELGSSTQLEGNGLPGLKTSMNLERKTVEIKCNVWLKNESDAPITGLAISCKSSPGLRIKRVLPSHSFHGQETKLATLRNLHPGMQRRVLLYLVPLKPGDHEVIVLVHQTSPTTQDDIVSVLAGSIHVAKARFTAIPPDKYMLELFVSEKESGPFMTGNRSLILLEGESGSVLSHVVQIMKETGFIHLEELDGKMDDIDTACFYSLGEISEPGERAESGPVIILVRYDHDRRVVFLCQAPTKELLSSALATVLSNMLDEETRPPNLTILELDCFTCGGLLLKTISKTRRGQKKKKDVFSFECTTCGSKHHVHANRREMT